MIEPNDAVDRIVEKYEMLSKHLDLMRKIYGDFFFVPEYKQFVLERGGIMDCVHVAQLSDAQIVKVQKPIDPSTITSDTDVFFCISINSVFGVEVFDLAGIKTCMI